MNDREFLDFALTEYYKQLERNEIHYKWISFCFILLHANFYSAWKVYKHLIISYKSISNILLAVMCLYIVSIGISLFFLIKSSFGNKYKLLGNTKLHAEYREKLFERCEEKQIAEIEAENLVAKHFTKNILHQVNKANAHNRACELKKHHYCNLFYVFYCISFIFIFLKFLIT